jgi:hypothetical protein
MILMSNRKKGEGTGKWNREVGRKKKRKAEQ